MSDEAVRYEINHDGQIVKGQAALSNRLDDLVNDMFSQFGWNYYEESKQSTHRVAKLISPENKEYILDLFTARIRNEKRSPYEKKIQLSKEDPRKYQDNITLILGFYVYEELDSVNDAIIVGYPIDSHINYETNPSIRGTFVNDILYKAKVNGICIDKERKMVGFRPEFIYFYLNEYRRIHGYEKGNIEDVRTELYCQHNSDYIDKPLNRIIFGAPGTGKSHKLEEDSKLFGENMERVTFHPNYSYAQFVGTYKPIQGENPTDIKYEYVPGPFMRTYVNALNNPEKKFLLLIEEINRANVAAVFGDVFQLLDRKNGVSEYPIATSEDIKKHLLENLDCLKDKDINELSEEEKKMCLEMKIPENMYIWATMNSADQGVFPMDTAFKRRWEFEYISVNEPEQVAKIEKYVIPMCANTEQGYYVNWNDLRTRINSILIDNCKVNEDKLLGPFFISKNMLDDIKANKDEKDRVLATDEEIRSDEDNNILAEVHKKEISYMKAFESKVIMYLFEDVMKMRAEKIFIDYAQKKGKMIFSEICKAFEEDGEHIFGIADIGHLRNR